MASLKFVRRLSAARSSASTPPARSKGQRQFCLPVTGTSSTFLPSRSVSSTILLLTAKALSPATHDRIASLVQAADVVVFMKGVPEQPRCGFSNAVVQIFRIHKVKFDAHDVLKDEELRQGIKEYSSWPTIPQVFFKGEFIGGCDILLQMHQSGELIQELEKIGIKSALVGAIAQDEKQ